MKYKTYNRGLIFSGAPHKEICLDKNKAFKLMKDFHALYCRNVFNFDSSEETSFWFVIKDHFDGMDELKSKVRNQVRRSLNTFEVKPISKEYMLQFGYNVYLSSFERYRDISSSPMTIERWNNYVENQGDEYEYWGAINRDSEELIAYSENLIQSDACKYVALKVNPSYLKNYPFYGLLYKMNEYYLIERKMKYVSDGARSITNHSNIQSFLSKFGFRRAYCDLNVTYVWWLRIIISLLYPFRNIIRNTKVKNMLVLEAFNRNEI
jgi:hypothetical protein